MSSSAILRNGRRRLRVPEAIGAALGTGAVRATNAAAGGIFTILTGPGNRGWAASTTAGNDRAIPALTQLTDREFTVKERQDDNPKSPEEVRERIWELADKIDICMFTTWDGEEQHSRPLSARVRRGEDRIYFLVDESGEKNGEIARFPKVSCAWADNGNYKYVLISGQAELSNDRAKISELWSKADEAWWEDETDPTIRLLTLTPEHGELWDSPGKAVALAKMMAAVVTGGAPEMGDNAKVDL